ncbi:MAG: 2-dehydropantoate 2-reductase [Pseudomonadales bacterium]|nr:2-dehydropantoate 2-reductase [Pseudomonadales bacterium]
MTNWTLLGAGAIGGLFACELKAAGIDVTLINRAHLPLTNRSIAIERENHRQSYEFSIQPSESAIQQLILATKTYQSEAAITQIEQQLSENCIIVVLQNGMGTTEWLQSKFPKAIVLAATTTHGAFRSDPHTIVHAGMGATWIGPLNEATHTIAQQLYTQWQSQGVAIAWDANIQKRLWEKLAINCAINPLTVLYDCRNGELLHIDAARQTMAAVITEFSEVYKALFPTVGAEHWLKQAYSVAEKTAQNISSMRQDVMNKRPTEIEAINGYLVTKGQEVGIECPVNAQLVNQIKELTRYD